MKCPKDGAVMEEKAINGTMLDFCTKCGGVWMDWGELTRISGNRATEHELLFRGESNFLCPRCGMKMQDADLHSVTVEECKCGIFFDGGEAEKVVGRILLPDNQGGASIRVTKDDLRRLLDEGRVKVGTTEILLVK